MAQYPNYDSIRRIGILGAGTIGSSWATYFLAQGFQVSVWDPADGWRDRMVAFIDNAWPHMEALGLAPGADKSAISFHDSPGDAVAGVGFVQENAPEKMQVKRDLYRRIDNALPEKTILSSSTSGLIMSDMQDGFASAGRFVVGHPFNPPHLIPLVEVVAGKDTDPAAVDWSIGFYNHIGKHAIRINKEVPGHLANRLQAALWREAVLAVKNDLASVEDINAAVAQGPGLRWALMGPHMIMNLAGGKGGFRQMIDHFGPGMQSWWETMTENPELTPSLSNALIEGVAEEAGERSINDLEEERDERLIRLLTMLKETTR
jgi:3-hydroxyacyl-CoA dehydrogenase